MLIFPTSKLKDLFYLINLEAVDSLHENIKFPFMFWSLNYTKKIHNFITIHSNLKTDCCKCSHTFQLTEPKFKVKIIYSVQIFIFIIIEVVKVEFYIYFSIVMWIDHLFVRWKDRFRNFSNYSNVFSCEVSRSFCEMSNLMNHPIIHAEVENRICEFSGNVNAFWIAKNPRQWN